MCVEKKARGEASACKETEGERETESLTLTQYLICTTTTTTTTQLQLLANSFSTRMSEEKRHKKKERNTENENENEKHGEDFVGEEGWRMLVEKTNITSQQSKQIKKYWAYWEIKLVYNGIFKPFAEPPTKEQLQVAFHGQSHIRSTPLFSQEKCRRVWKKAIHPLIVVRMFEIMDPLLPSMATFASAVIMFGKICRGTFGDRLSLLFTMMDVDDDGFISRADVYRIFYLACKSHPLSQTAEKIELPKNICDILDLLFSNSNIQMLKTKKVNTKKGPSGKKTRSSKKNEGEEKKSRKLKKKRSKAVDIDSEGKKRQHTSDSKKEDEQRNEDGQSDEEENEEENVEETRPKQTELGDITDLLQAVIILQRWWRRVHRQRVIERWVKLQEAVVLKRAEEIRLEREANKNHATREKFNFFQIHQSHSDSEDDADVGEDEGAGDDDGAPLLRKSSFEGEDLSESPRLLSSSLSTSLSSSSSLSSLHSSSSFSMSLGSRSPPPSSITPRMRGNTGLNSPKTSLLSSSEEEELAAQNETARYFQAIYAIHCERVDELEFNAADMISMDFPSHKIYSSIVSFSASFSSSLNFLSNVLFLL